MTLDDVLMRLEAADLFTVIESIQQESDPQTAIGIYNELVRHFYWQKKDLYRTVVFAQAGIQFGLTTANTSYEVRSAVKGLAYDLASFTWAGWDEPGLVISEREQQLGLDAARLNLRLAQELEKGDLPLARAHWMLGAQLLAAKQFDAARGHFDQSARYAEAAQNQGETLLARGFAALAAKPFDAADLQTVQTELATLEDGEGFVQQIETARRVFAIG